MAIRREDSLYVSELQSGGHGEEYQIDTALSLLLLMRRSSSTIRMAYEMKLAEKFDDIVLLDDERKQIHFLQVKHAYAKNGKVKNIGLDELFSTTRKEVFKSDFDLSKYIKSFLSVTHNFEEIGYEKNFYILTNRDLEITNNEWLQTEERILNEIVCFSRSKSRHLKLIPTVRAIKELRQSINKDIIEVKNAIKELFTMGNIKPILIDYSTPLRDILTIGSNNKCSFSGGFNLESKQLSVARLYNMLQCDSFDFEKEVTVELDFLHKPSRNKLLPPWVSEDEVLAFFHDFTLTVQQLKDLRRTIDSELRMWLKTWVHPDVLGKLSEKEFDHLYTVLKRDFTYFFCGGKLRPFLKRSDIEKILGNIQLEMQKCLMNYANVTYINRKIRFEEVVVEPTGAQYMSIKGVDMAEKLERKLTNEIQKHPLNDKIIDANPKTTIVHYISDTEFVEEFQGLFKDQQHILLVADPGMGKSTLLQYVAFEVQKQYNVDVFFVCFSDLVKKLDEIKEISSFEYVPRVFSDVLSKESCNAIKNVPDQRMTNGYSIIVAFDGYDEIHAKYTDRVIQLLEQLSLKKNIQIIISTRPHGKESLEERFKAKSMFLEPFSGEDQIRYLKQMWNVPDNDESFVVYSNQMCLSEVFGLPLMMRMFAEIFSDKFNKNCATMNTENKQHFDLSEVTLNSAQLFDQFVIKCFHMKLMDKYQQCCDFHESELDSLIGGYILEHQLLAIKLLDLKIFDNLFKNPSIKQKYDTFIRRCKLESEKSLLVKVVNNKVQFSHFCFSEYFVAKYLCDHINIVGVESVIRILYEHDVMRKLAMMILGETKIYFKIMNLFNLESQIALVACESGYLRMVSSSEDNFGSFSIFKFNMILQLPEKSEIRKFLIGFYKKLDKRTALHSADQNRHVKIVKLSLSCKANVERQDTSIIGPLHTTNVAEFSIENSTDLNKVDKQQWTGLHFTSHSGHEVVVKILIEWGRKSCSPSMAGKTPLYIAAQNGHTDIVAFLIDEHSDLNEMDEDHWTALHWAAKNGCFAVVQILLVRGANSSSRAMFGETPLHIAAQRGHREVAELLLKHNSDPNVTDDYQWTSLHWAARNGHEAMVKLLLEYGASSTVWTVDCQTPLHIAALNGHAGVARILIKSNSNLNEADKMQWTALHFAARNGHVAVAKSLIDSDVNIHSQTKFGETPLHIAALHGHVSVAELLVKSYCNPNEKDEGQWTALHWAAQNGHVAVVQILIANGADPNSTSFNGKTPLHIAALKGHAGVADVLIENNCDLNKADEIHWTALHFAAQNGNMLVIKHLVEKGTDVCSKTVDGSFPLHIAAFNGHMGAVEFLIMNHADPNEEDKHRWTALHCAAYNGHLAVVKLLIDKGVNIHSMTDNGSTPLDIAEQNGYVNCVELLKEHNYDQNVMDKGHCKAQNMHEAVVDSSVCQRPFRLRRKGYLKTCIACPIKSKHKFIFKKKF